MAFISDFIVLGYVWYGSVHFLWSDYKLRLLFLWQERGVMLDMKEKEYRFQSYDIGKMKY